MARVLAVAIILTICEAIGTNLGALHQQRPMRTISADGVEQSLVQKLVGYGCTSLDGPLCYLLAHGEDGVRRPPQGMSLAEAMREIGRLEAQDYQKTLKKMLAVTAKQPDKTPTGTGPQSDTPGDTAGGASSSSQTVSTATGAKEEQAAENGFEGEGYFTNSSPFFGPNRKEYLHITRNAKGSFEAFKLVGDANVPRGKVSFRTHNLQSSQKLAQALKVGVTGDMQVRANRLDERGYRWVPVNVRYADGEWSVVRTDRTTPVGRFTRISHHTAERAAAILPDLN